MRGRDAGPRSPWLRSGQGLAFVGGAVLTVAVLLAPPGSRSLPAPAGRLALEIAGLCAVLVAALILAVPEDRDVRPARNVFVAGLVVLALSNAVFTVWPVLLDSRLPLDRGLAYYPWLVARSVAGLLFISTSLGRPRLRLSSAVTAAVALVLVIDLALLAWPGELVVPVAARGSGADTTIEVLAPGWNALLQTLPGALFAVGAWLAGRFHRRTGAPAYGWLSVALVVQTFAQLHEVIAPAFLGPVVTTADAFRLIAFLLLLAGSLHQLGFLYRSRSRAVRAQQRDLDVREQVVSELGRFAEREQDFRTLVSHELATPIATIRAFVHVLRAESDGAATSNRQRRAMEGIDAESRRLLELVERMEELRELEGSSFRCALRPVLLRPIVQDAAGFVRGLPGLHRVVLRTVDVRVMADPLRLGQALRNVLVNAVRYSPETAPVTIEAEPEGARLRLTVADEGPGIPAHDLGRVVHRYARGSDADAGGGHGLGLYVASQIAEAHGAPLSIHSDHTGTRVSLSLAVVG